MVDAGVEVDFFISHAGRDRAWAEWVAAQLRSGGHVVELDSTDWVAGDDFMARMTAALASCKTMIALWSPAYFAEGSFALRELVAADLAKIRVVPLRVEELDPPPLWRHLIYQDLFRGDADQARLVLLAAVTGRPASGGGAAEFPKPSSGPRLPGSLPRVWNMPSRSPVFTGRDELLVGLRESLLGDRRTAVYALHGLGGVGKTQLAVEYAYRFAGEYELGWWVNAEQPALIGEQLVGLGVAVGMAGPGMDIPSALEAVRGFLRGRDRWLVVFDNVPAAADVVDWVPQGLGHVIITSRSPGWVGVAAGLSVDVFDRAESIGLLRAQLTDLAESDANELAGRLGDLPLALAQAVGVMTETGMPAAEYGRALAASTAMVLAAGVPVGYPVSLAASVLLAVARLTAADEAAGQLVRLCALLGPEPIPLWLIAHGGSLPAPSGPVTQDAWRLRQCVGLASRYGLLRIGTDAVTMHRLTQAVIRADLPDSAAPVGRPEVEALLVAASPDDGTDPAWWPRWGQLLPHILAADPGTTSSRSMMNLAYHAVWHLHARGDYRTALPIAERLRRQWQQRHGDDDHEVLRATDNVASIHRGLGEYERARQLDEDTFARRRRVLGEDHPDTLTSANNLAIDLWQLGQFERACLLDEDTLVRRRRVLGEDHPATLTSAGNLAVDLGQLGQFERACLLDEDTFARRRRVLGEDHPDTLISAGNLAVDLGQLGQFERARLLDEDTLARRRSVLGEDHPRTLTSASNVAANLHQLGQFERARQLDEDTLARRRRVLGEDHPDTLRSTRNLAKDVRVLGDGSG